MSRENDTAFLKERSLLIIFCSPAVQTTWNPFFASSLFKFCYGWWRAKEISKPFCHLHFFDNPQESFKCNEASACDNKVPKDCFLFHVKFSFFVSFP